MLLVCEAEPPDRGPDSRPNLQDRFVHRPFDETGRDGPCDMEVVN